MQRVITLLICYLLSGTLFGQNSIGGIVSDESNHGALPGVNVYIPELQKGTITNEDGHYDISNIPEGLFKIQYSYIGYKTQIIAFNIADRQAINISLAPTTILFQEVIITGGRIGSQHENAIKIESLRKEMLDNAPAENLFQKITQIPGIHAISKGNNIATPVIRGLSTTNIVLLNNGIRMENYQFSEDHPYTIDESDVSTVEVIKGPASLLYGSDAVGGVLNFIKAPPVPVGNISAFVGANYNTNDKSITNTVNLKASGNNFFGGLSGYLHSARDYYDGNGMFIPNTRSNSYSAKLFGGYRNTNGLFSLYYDYNKLQPGVTNDASIKLIKENSRKNEVWYQDLDNHVFAFKNQLFFNKLKLDVDLSYQFNKRNLFGNPEAPAFKLVDMSLNNYIWQLKGQYDFSNKSNLVIVSQGLIQTSENGAAPVYVLPDYSLSGNSVAGLWQYQFGKKTYYQIGIRYDYKVIHAPEQYKSGISTEVLEAFNESYGNVSFSSGFTWKLHEHTLLRGNIASAYRTPSIAELLQDGIHANRYEIGNRDFVPQRNIEGDIGIHYHSDKLAVDFSTFYNRIFDYIFLAPTNDTTDIGMDIFRYSQNNATLYGIEFFSEYSLLNWLKVNVAYAHVSARQSNGAYLPFIPQDKININFHASKTGNGFFGKVQAGINPLVAFNQNRPHEFETRTEHYFLLNAFVKTKLHISKQEIEFGLFANNLLNTNYYDHLSTLKDLGYYNMGRNISLKLKIPLKLN